jgi:hypothetical protein
MQELTKLYLLTATRVLALLRQDTFTVEEYARSLLGRIDERDSIVKAWTYISKLRFSSDRAREKYSLLLPQIRNWCSVKPDRLTRFPMLRGARYMAWQ